MSFLHFGRFWITDGSNFKKRKRKQPYCNTLLMPSKSYISVTPSEAGAGNTVYKGPSVMWLWLWVPNMRGEQKEKKKEEIPSWIETGLSLGSNTGILSKIQQCYQHRLGWYCQNYVSMWMRCEHQRFLAGFPQGPIRILKSHWTQNDENEPLPKICKDGTLSIRQQLCYPCLPMNSLPFLI